MKVEIFVERENDVKSAVSKNWKTNRKVNPNKEMMLDGEFVGEI
jgi:hypothetical protein